MQLIINESQELPASFAHESVETLEKFNEFKKKLDAEIGQVYETIGWIEREISLNLYNEETKKGFLTSPKDSYLSCFKCDLEIIDSLLDKDKAKWTGSVKIN